jgi:glycosyltransferase involved in cell wall biosynthesis
VNGRVLQVIPSVSPVHGGPSAAIRLIEKALAGSGWAIETATTDDDGPGRRLAARARDALGEGGVRRWYFDKSTERYKAAWSFLPWIRRNVSHYDVVHIHALFSFLSVAAAMAARRAGVPYVVRPLGVLNRYGMTQRRPALKRLSVKFVEGPLLRNAAAVHFTAEAERDEAAELGLELNPVVIPLAIEPGGHGDAGRLLARHPGMKDHVRVLYLSRIDPKKNLEGLIDAMALLREKGRPVSLMIAGGGVPAYVGELERRAAGRGLADRVHWLGTLDGDDKRDALAAADIFALPSFSENFGIAAAEALADGIPCVVGRGVALSALIERGGAGLAVETTPDSIADAIDHYLLSPSAREDAGAAGRMLARDELSVDRMRERLVDLYESVARPGQAAHHSRTMK